MQIVEVKNNLVKISYDTAGENIILSGFVVIKDAAQSFIGQIIHLDANSEGNFAVIKLLFTFDDSGIIKNYNGSIPDIKSLLDTVHPQELLELLPAQNPIILGELAQQNTLLKIDRTFLEENMLICSEKEEDNKLLIKNLAQQLKAAGKKVLVIDCIGDLEFAQDKITAGKDFKLPLNYELINFIYEKGLESATSETKALIQEIFLEVQNYIKTLDEKFIPFESFKNVVDSQYQETDLVELVLLKNKLLKYYEDGVFAQNKKEFDSLKNSLENSEVTVFDLSDADEKIQREMISYAYTLINKFDDEKIYVICNLENENSDKKLLKQVFMTKKAYPVLICSYSYKYLKELKQLSKNLILFAPIQQQNDFAGYNIFLNKLNAHEFIIYGKSTHYLPLIVKLEEISEVIEREEENETNNYSAMQSSDTEEDVSSITSNPQQDDLDEQIKRDVDKIYTTPREQNFNVEVVEDELTEDDLDFIEDLNIIEDTDEEVNQEINELPYEETISNDEYIENDTVEETENFEPQIEEDLSELQDESIIEKNDTEEMIEEIDENENISPFSSVDSYSVKPSENSFANVLSSQGQEEPESPSAIDILPVKMSSAPIVPVYSAQVEPKVQSDEIEQGDIVSHPKYGKGIVEKLISYGSKTLCSINFDNVGRRLLDPTLAELKKIGNEIIN